MNSSNDLTTSLLQSSENSMPDIMSTASSSSDGEGFFESIKNISVTTWLLIVLIFAFLISSIKFFFDALVVIMIIELLNCSLILFSCS